MTYRMLYIPFAVFEHFVRMASWSRKLAGLSNSGRRQNLTTLILSGVVSTELMWIIKVRHETEDLKRNVGTQIALTRRVTEKLRRGEQVDVKRELMLDSEESSLQNVLDEIVREPPQTPRRIESTELPKGVTQTETGRSSKFL